MLNAMTLSARAEMKIQEVTSPKGVKAWLVEDYAVPIVAIRFAFKGGYTQDPTGKEGLANLMTGLFDEGAGDLDSDAFQTKLDDCGAEMSFSSGRDEINGAMRMLEDQKDAAFDLLALAVNKPRFDQAPIDRVRSQIITGLISDEHSPEKEAADKWRKALYGDHPYSHSDDGTQETLKSITADDLRAFRQKNFGRDNLYIGVVGAIDAKALGAALDKVFGDLPAKAELTPVPDVAPKLGQKLSVQFDLPQTKLQYAYPGINRDDPQFFAAYLMNYILGGGSFSSRLFDEVREKRGLAYGVDSALLDSDHDNMLTIVTATRSDRAAETIQVIRDTIAKFVAEGATPKELEDAKKYVTGAYAINNLNSSSAIAGTLLQLQLDNLGIDYIARRPALIAAVTLDQVKAAAKALLSADPTMMVVGPKGAVAAE